MQNQQAMEQAVAEMPDPVGLLVNKAEQPGRAVGHLPVSFLLRPAVPISVIKGSADLSVLSASRLAHLPGKSVGTDGK